MGLMGRRRVMRLREKEIVIQRSSGSMIQEQEGDGIMTLFISIALMKLLEVTP